MSQFSKTFLRDRIGDDKRPQSFFGIFGKHPGWDDHIEDLPLPTASMAAAKQRLYVEGIGSQISSGAWARLPDSARLEGFDHVFVWLRGPQFLIGRMWASSDGKRRTHYPMIALVHCLGMRLEAVLPAFLLRLETVATGCRGVDSAQGVRELTRGDWSAQCCGSESSGGDCTLHASRAQAVQIARGARSHPHTRTPAEPGELARSVTFWIRVFTGVLSAETPLLILAPIGKPWLDVLTGEPAPERFFCLRAMPEALPLDGGDAVGTPERIESGELISAVAGAASASEAAASGSGWFSKLLGH